MGIIRPGLATGCRVCLVLSATAIFPLIVFVAGNDFPFFYCSAFSLAHPVMLTLSAYVQGFICSKQLLVNGELVVGKYIPQDFEEVKYFSLNIFLYIEYILGGKLYIFEGIFFNLLLTMISSTFCSLFF